MGKSKYNPIFEFESKLNNIPMTLRVTSVLGHVMGLKYPDHCKNWSTTDMDELYQIPLLKVPIESSEKVVQNLKLYCRDVDTLVIWTDCDREGEAIGYDIIDICRKIKPNLDVYRAHFSALTHEEISTAANQLARPNKALSDAVKVRQEIDLRIGASFTRFQTLLLRDVLQRQGVLSYGPCQFPTLGFIVERANQIKEFWPEKFWYISMKYTGDGKDKDQSAVLEWQRHRIFDKLSCLVLYEKVTDSGDTARVLSVEKKPKFKGKPFPLNTVEATKLISRKLRISPE